MKKISKISEALSLVNRKDFIPASEKMNSEVDAPLPIGYGQTISQPTTVRLMLTWLDPKPGSKVLDVGSGSGWTTALLAHIVGPTGKVFALEIVPELLDFGKSNCTNLRVTNAEFILAAGEYGYSPQAPYDKILVNAAAQELPEELLSQLSVRGTLVIPVKNNVLEINKISENKYETSIHPGFVFVPLLNPN